MGGGGVRATQGAPPPGNIWTQSCTCEVNSFIHVPCFLLVVDRRGESEESGDDDTRRRSINGDVDPGQAAGTGESSRPQRDPVGGGSEMDPLLGEVASSMSLELQLA